LLREAVLVTGANRGLEQALVEEALGIGARRPLVHQMGASRR
jgi:hypothetical protein